MKALKLLLLLSIVALFIVAGCNKSTPPSYVPQGQQYVGGGCGVNAPAESNSNTAVAVATTTDTFAA